MLREARQSARGFRKLSGLARAEALVDGFQISSQPGAGCRAELTLHNHQASFDDHDGTTAPFEVDLTEHEYLSPQWSTRLLGTPPDTEQPWFELPPALATCLGRLLSGSDRKWVANSSAPNHSQGGLQ